MQKQVRAQARDKRNHANNAPSLSRDMIPKLGELDKREEERAAAEAQSSEERSAKLKRDNEVLNGMLEYLESDKNEEISSCGCF